MNATMQTHVIIMLNAQTPQEVTNAYAIQDMKKMKLFALVVFLFAIFSNLVSCRY